MNPLISRAVGLLGTGILLVLIATWGNSSEVTKQFGLAYWGLEDTVDPTYMGSIGNPSVSADDYDYFSYDASALNGSGVWNQASVDWNVRSTLYTEPAAPNFTTGGAEVMWNTTGYADPNPWYLYGGTIAPEAMSESAWQDTGMWNPQNWEPGLVDSFEAYPTGYDIYNGDYTAADMWLDTNETEWGESESEPGYGDRMWLVDEEDELYEPDYRYRVYPVYTEDTYYEESWYEEVAPVRSWGCTYFGWCDTQQQTVSTHRISAPSYTYTAPSYTYTAAQPNYTTYQPSAPSNPTCDITVSPSYITEGEGVTLMWTSENATAVYNEKGSKVGSSGIQGLRPTETHTYQLTVYGSNGSVNRCQTTVQVKQDAPLSCNIAARQKKIEAGDGVELVWSAPSAQRAAISGIGEVSYSGAQMVYPNRTTTYELRVVDRDGKVQTCTTQVEVVAAQQDGDGWFDFSYGGFGGSLSDLVGYLDNGRSASQSSTQASTQSSVTTTTQPPVYVPPPVVPECKVTVLPQRIEAGGSVYLEWAMPNDAHGYIQGVGYVSGSGFQTVSPQQTTTYTLTVQSPRGTRTCAAAVEVAPAAPQPACTITASPAQVSSTQKTTLSWATQNAVSAELLGAGNMALRGSTQVLPGFTRTYTLRVAGQSGKTAVCNTTVTVPQPQTSTPSTVPSCTISASPSSIPTGGKTILTWSARNASNANINNGVGTVALSGSKEVILNQATTYSLTVTDQTGKRAQCSTTVNVEAGTSCALVCGGQTYVCTPAPTAQICGITQAQPNVQLTSEPLQGAAGTDASGGSGNWFTNLFNW